jgi:peptide chain release factor 2
MITQDQLKDVLDRAEKLKHYLRIDEKQIEWEEEDLRTQAPDFWDDPKRAEAQMKKVKAIKSVADAKKRIRQSIKRARKNVPFGKAE